MEKQQIKPGTLLRLRKGWVNEISRIFLKQDDVIMIVTDRSQRNERIFHFNALTPDGVVKGFAGDIDSFDHFFGRPIPKCKS